MLQKTYTVSLAVALLLGYAEAKIECSMVDSSYRCFNYIMDGEIGLGEGNAPGTYESENWIHKGTWGSWGGWYWTPGQDYLACGIRLRSESNCDCLDNTATNSIAFKWCNINDWNQ